MSFERLAAALADRYRIERELGGGGMSRVFLAQEIALHREVVIKVLAPSLSEGVSAERFGREIQLAASLQQANIVPLLAAGSADGLPYYVMPYVQGESLRARLTPGHAIGLAESIGILRDLARALAYAHARAVVHRDIKPENILLSGGAAVVTDFGIAKALSAARTLDGDSALTQTGTSIGTPAYMAPEQAAGDPGADARADVYAWGIVAYELLAGRHPFASRTSAHALVTAHLTETPQPIRAVRGGVPQPLADLVQRALAKDPSHRPQSASEILTVLDAIGTPDSVAAGTLSPAAGRRRLIAGALVALAAVCGMLWISSRRAASPGAAAAPTEVSLAVLPIENIGGDSANQYLADGMTGELAGALKHVPGLQVVGDLSVARFKGKQVDPGTMARELGVRMLLTGKLQQAAGRVRLQMQLSDPQGKLVWSDRFVRDTKDNFAMQDEITDSVASEMRVVLTPMTLAVARAGRTVNADAHDLFLRGQFEKNKLTPNGLARAQEYFQQALRLDPNYAQAHAGLAFVYDIQADVYAPSHKYHTLAMHESNLAVAADSLLAEGRVLHGFEIAAATWDFAAGQAEMDRGLKLNPNSQDALVEMASFSLLSGDTARALALTSGLVALDPLSPLAARERAEALLWAGRYQEALQESHTATRLDPTVTFIDATDGNALRELGRLDESLAAFLDFKKDFGLPSFGIIMTYAKMGRRDDALREIHSLEARAKTAWVDPDLIAIGYAAVGDSDHAMAWLDKAFAMKTFGLRLFLNWDCPWLRPLWHDPRYIALQQKVRATIWTS